MAEYYVSSSATGSGTGTSVNPWTLSQISSAADRDVVYIKADGTYSVSVGISINNIRLIGYTSSIGDRGQATIQLTAGVTAFSGSGVGIKLDNLIFDGGSIASATALSCNDFATSWEHKITNCVFKNFAVVPVYVRGCAVDGCRFYLCEGGCINRPDNGDIHITNTVFDDCAGTLVRCVALGNNSFERTAFIRMRGIGVDIGVNGSATFSNCTFHKKSGTVNAVNFASFAGDSNQMDITFRQCVFAGLDKILNSTGNNTLLNLIDCALYNVTTTTSGGTVFSTGQISCSIDPFADIANGNFALNNVLGGGAALRGLRQTFNGSSTTQYIDIGAAQHPDTFVGEVAVTF